MICWGREATSHSHGEAEPVLDITSQMSFIWASPDHVLCQSPQYLMDVQVGLSYSIYIRLDIYRERLGTAEAYPKSA